MKTTIQITSLDIKPTANGSDRIVIKDNTTSYSFFSKKRDGNPTKAQETFQQLNPRIGDNVTVEIEEKPGTNKMGQPVIYRNIIWFYTNLQEQERIQSPIQLEAYEGSENGVANGNYQLQLDRIEIKLEEVLEYIHLKQQAKAPLPLTPSFPAAPIGQKSPIESTIGTQPAPYPYTATNSAGDGRVAVPTPTKSTQENFVVPEVPEHPELKIEEVPF